MPTIIAVSQLDFIYILLYNTDNSKPAKGGMIMFFKIKEASIAAKQSRSKSRLDLKVLQKFKTDILKNWLKMTDQEIAENWPCSQYKVLKIRLKMGLKRKRKKTKAKILFWQQKGKLEFLRANWQKMSDKKIARHLKCYQEWVKKKRLALGLNRKEAKGKIEQAKLSTKKLTKLLNQEGLTKADVARQIGVCREAIRQLCKKRDIRVNKTPAWYVNRLKKTNGN